MATPSQIYKKQDVAIKMEPKFSSGYEFYFPSIHFGKTWARRKFGETFSSSFLIGTVKKARLTKKKSVEYDVSFALDGSRYVYSEEVISKQLPCTT